MLEKDIQKQIIDYLTIKNIFHWRNNTTGIYDPVRHTFRKNKNVMNGIPDIICIINGQFVGIEVKSETGKQSPEQKKFEEMCVSKGGKYILARSVEDVMKGLI